MVKANQLKEFLPPLDGFVLKGRLLFNPPLKHLLRGMYFDASSSKTSFYIQLFVMPLCVPTDHLYFTFGERIRTSARRERWNTAMPNLKEEVWSALQDKAIPYLSKVTSLSDFVALAETNPRTVRSLEGLGYALARLGMVDRALAVLDELLGKIDPSRGWEQELSVEITRLRSTLMSAPDEVPSILSSVEARTINALGLDE